MWNDIAFVVASIVCVGFIAYRLRRDLKRGGGTDGER